MCMLCVVCGLNGSCGGRVVDGVCVMYSVCGVCCLCYAYVVCVV